MHTYHTPLDLVRERSPERPVALVRRGAVALAARWFQDNFKGDVLYAVKANPSPWVIETLVAGGVTGFDVASIPEIELVNAHAPDAKLAFMHPVKSRQAIAAAYFDHGVRTFALDTHEELAKLIEATGEAKDLNLIVRLAVSTEGARKPWAPPDMTPKVSAASARTAVTWPSGSSGAASRGERGARIASSARTAAPTGRLTQKQARHDQWSVSQPPSVGPKIDATPHTAANSP